MRITINAGNEALNWISFKGPMRIAPTMTLYNPAGTNAQVRNIGTGVDFSSCTADQSNIIGFSVAGTTDSGATAGNQLAYNWSAEAEVV